MFKNILNIILIIMVSSSLSFAENTTTTNVNTGTSSASTVDNSGNPTTTEGGGFNASVQTKTKLQDPLSNLFESTQWDLFLKEFELNMKVGTCCNDNILDCAIGLEAHMIEPLGYVEQTQKPMYFPFANLTLATSVSSILKGDSLQNSSEDDTTSRGQTGDAHFLYVPIMGMIFKKKLNFVCFHKGNLAFPYLSEFDPTWKKDYYYMKMIPHMIEMFSPQGLLSSIFDCIATESANALLGYQSGSSLDMSQVSGAGEVGDSTDYDLIGDSNKVTDFEKSSLSKLNGIRDTFYFINGCNGYAPIGGYASGGDPITDLQLRWYGIQGLMHAGSTLSPVPFLYKSTNANFMFAGISGEATKEVKDMAIQDTMCKWSNFPLQIDSQYLLQLAYPTVGKAHENGSTGVTVSTAKNIPGAANSAVYVVWGRRDYYAFAYFCDGGKKGHK